jgi:tetratricopeptide (TPR) repeat protein
MHAHDAAPPVGQQNPYVSFARGLAAVGRQRFEEAEARVAELRAARASMSAGEAYRARQLEIMELEVAAALDSARGRHAEAIELMKRATALEEEMSPPSGPPEVVKPSHEMFGEILLRAGKPAEAAALFDAALRRQPNRTRSLLGAARAAAQTGDRARAAALYAELLRVLEHADEGLPETREAREFTGQKATTSDR